MQDLTQWYFRAVLETCQSNYEDAAGHISKAQSEVYNELQARTAYLDFSASNYASAIQTLAKAQVIWADDMYDLP